jgi:hypothetical protein
LHARSLVLAIGAALVWLAREAVGPEVLLLMLTGDG